MIKKRNKIKLIIFPGNFLPHTGGLESHVDNFVKYLSKLKKYDITIFSPDILGAKQHEIIYQNVKVLRYPAFEAVYNYPCPKFWQLRFWKLFIKLYKNDYDIVMTRTMFFTNSTLGWFFAKLRFKRLKLVHVEHASDFSRLASGFKGFVNKIYMYTLGRLILTSSDRVVAISDAVKVFLAKSFIKNQNKAKQIPVIRRGFDYNYAQRIKPDLKLRNKYQGKKIISFVGRLIEGKGLQDVIDILPQVKHDYVLVVLGDGLYRKHLEKQVRLLKLEDRVVFKGKVKHKEVISTMKASDLVVNPSHTEGLPTSVLDGVFSEVKVLATDVGGTYEILDKDWKKKCYRLVEMRNKKEILKGINYLLSTKEKVDNKIIQTLEKKFDWDNHALEYDVVLSEVVKG